MLFLTIFLLILLVSLYWSAGNFFDVAYGARGCLVTAVFMIVFGSAGLAILLPAQLLGLTKWLDLIPVNAVNVYRLMWFLALFLGGYTAARLGRTTGWTNSLVVGIFAESFLFAMLLDILIMPDFGGTLSLDYVEQMFEKPWAYWGRLPGRLFDHLIEMLQEPDWGHLPNLVLTIPAAVLGGVLWQRSQRVQRKSSPPILSKPSCFVDYILDLLIRPPRLRPDTEPHKPSTLENKIPGFRLPILGFVILCLLVLAIILFDEPAVVKAIKDRGGRVKGDPVVSVAFPSSASVSDADLKVLKELTSLKTLNLDSTNITDEGLKELKEFATLESLTLSNTKITDAGLKELKPFLKLRTLTLSGTEVTDEGLKELNELKSLQSLTLSGSEITGAGLKELKELSTLTSLYLNGPNFMNAGLKDLKELKNLRFLNLNSTNITDAGLNELKELPSLKTLFLRETKITDTGLKQFKAARPGIRVHK